MAETEMVEKVARAIAYNDASSRDWLELNVASQRVYRKLARAAIEAMKDAPTEILGAMYEAMFEDKWDGSQAPMVGAGWDAAIDAAIGLARGEG